MKEKMYVQFNNNKIYKSVYINNISMLPGDLEGLPDAFIFLGGLFNGI